MIRDFYKACCFARNEIVKKFAHYIETKCDGEIRCNVRWVNSGGTGYIIKIYNRGKIPHIVWKPHNSKMELELSFDGFNTYEIQEIFKALSILPL